MQPDNKNLVVNAGNMNATPINIKPVAPATEAPALEGQLSAFAQEQAKASALAQTELAAQRKEFTTALESGQGEASLKEKFGTELGLGEKEKEVSRLSAELLSEQRALENSLRSLDKNKQGLFGGQLEAEKGRVRTESLQRQADIAVVQYAAQGQLDSVQRMLNRKVDVALEQEAKKLEARKLTYEDAKSAFTKAEQRAFETRYNEEKSRLDAKREDAKTKNDLILNMVSNGAPQGVIRAATEAKDVASVMKAGASYLNRYDRLKADAQIAASRASERKSLIEASLAGDPAAAQKLGFDPMKIKNKEDFQKNEDAFKKAKENIARVNSALLNDTGLMAVSGAMRSPLLSGFGSQLILGHLGEKRGMFDVKLQSENFLNDVGAIVKIGTLSSFLEAKAAGAAFGSMTESEWEIIRGASSDLAASAIIEDGNIVGFRGSEDRVRDNLRKVSDTYKTAMDKENVKLLGSDDKDEIRSAYYGK